MTLEMMRQVNEILERNGRVPWPEESAKYFVKTSLLEKGQATTYVSSGNTESYVVYAVEKTVTGVAHVNFRNSRCDFLS